MPALALSTAASVTCPHGAPVTISPGSARVLVAGAPVALLTDMTTVLGCPFQAGPKPQPCVSVRWFVGSARVLAGGVPVLLQTSTGLAASIENIPAGPPLIAGTQPRAMAS